MSKVIYIKGGTEKLFLGEYTIVKEKNDRCLCVFQDGVIWIDKHQLV